MKKDDLHQNELTIISKLNWEYTYSPEELWKLIKDKGNKSDLRICFFIKSLQTLDFETLVSLWSLDEIKNLYTEKIRKGHWPRELREKYYRIFAELNNGEESKLAWSGSNGENGGQEIQ